MSKGLVRPGYNPYPFNKTIADRLTTVLDAFEPDFTEMNSELARLPSTLSRFERTGLLKYEQLLSIGTVGMSARMNALERDIRRSHPYGVYGELDHVPVIKHHGDCIFQSANTKRGGIAVDILFEIPLEKYS